MIRILYQAVVSHARVVFVVVVVGVPIKRGARAFVNRAQRPSARCQREIHPLVCGGPVEIIEISVFGEPYANRCRVIGPIQPVDVRSQGAVAIGVKGEYADLPHKLVGVENRSDIVVL